MHEAVNAHVAAADAGDAAVATASDGTRLSQLRACGCAAARQCRHRALARTRPRFGARPNFTLVDLLRRHCANLDATGAWRASLLHLWRTDGARPWPCHRSLHAIHLRAAVAARRLGLFA